MTHLALNWDMVKLVTNKSVEQHSERQKVWMDSDLAVNTGYQIKR